MSLYQEMRPKTLNEVFGQEQAVTLFKNILEQPAEKRPKVFLLEGMYGCGKTTLAAVFAQAIGIKLDSNLSGMDFHVLDGSKDRSIDRIREFTDLFGTHPMRASAEARVFVIDECHQLLAPAKEALLKKCEDVPPRTYIFFATTDGSKFSGALRSRCMVVPIKPVTPKMIYQSLVHVVKKMQVDIPTAELGEALQEIARNSENSCRVSMQILETYLLCRDVKEAIAMRAGTSGQLEADVYALCKAIVAKRAPWSQAAEFIKAYTGQDEPVRIAVLNYLNSCLINSSERDHARFLALMDCFISPQFYAGKAGLSYMLGQAWSLK